MPPPVLVALLPVSVTLVTSIAAGPTGGSPGTRAIDSAIAPPLPPLLLPMKDDASMRWLEGATPSYGLKAKRPPPLLPALLPLTSVAVIVKLWPLMASAPPAPLALLPAMTQWSIVRFTSLLRIAPPLS